MRVLNIAGKLGGLLALLLSGATAMAGSHSYQFERADGSTLGVITGDENADLVVAFKQLYTLQGEGYDASVAVSGVILTDENGISREYGAAPAARPALAADGGVAADTCAVADAATTMPLVITGANLPYDKTFDTSAATDNGDFRGSASDGLSAGGGKDTFWKFTPSVTGVYSIAATAGGSAGIGVWSGSCGALSEVGVAFNLFGNGTSNLGIALNGGTTYYVVYEDFFPSSNEISVRLQIAGPILPQGETAASAVDLSGKHWGIGFSNTYDTSANANTLSQPGVCAEPSYGDGNDIWFKLPPVTEAGTTHTLYATAGTLTNSYFVLYSHAVGESVASLVIEDCSADLTNSGGHGAGNDFMSEIHFLGDASRVYYLFVESETLSGPGGNGSFTLFGSGGTPKTESTTVENFYIGTGNVANFIYTGGVGETPQATLATPPALRIDRGLNSGKWGGYATTGSQYMYSFSGATYLTDPSVAAGYFLLGATAGDETGSYVYTYFPKTRVDLSYGEAELSFSLRYGSAAGTTTSLRLLLRSQYDSGHGEPGIWLISQPITVTGLTGSFSTTPIQHLNNLTELSWYGVNAPSKENLDALAPDDAEPIAIGALLPHGISLMLSDVNGLGFYINDNVKTGFTSGLIFDSVALTGIIAENPVTAAANWAIYQ